MKTSSVDTEKRSVYDLFGDADIFFHCIIKHGYLYSIKIIYFVLAVIHVVSVDFKDYRGY